VRRGALPVVAVVAVVGLIVFEVLSAGSNGNAAKPAPPLPTAVLQPPKATLATLRGKPALVNFWASWCDPCRKEAPELERFDRSLHGAARLVGVDYTDQEGAARSFLRRYGWTFPVLSDPDGGRGARYGLSGLPTTVVLDPRGRIVQTLQGPQTTTDLQRALESVKRTG
jgi:cytochrome c biogenesis protein CcmG, thiol:disulfide interchange protein DsbE